jgi:uncharacterized RDD family membrane protein YckC
MEDILTDVVAAPVLASKSKRWVACFLDYIICFVIWIIVSYFFGNVVIKSDGTRSWQLTGVPALIGMFIPWFLLIPGIEAISKGQTIGKAILQIRSAQMDGSKIPAGRAIARHLLDFIDYLPFFGIVGLIVSSNTSYKQRVGDLVANTIVVEK